MTLVEEVCEGVSILKHQRNLSFLENISYAHIISFVRLLPLIEMDVTQKAVVVSFSLWSIVTAQPDMVDFLVQIKFPFSNKLLLLLLYGFLFTYLFFRDEQFLSMFLLAPKFDNFVTLISVFCQNSVVQLG